MRQIDNRLLGFIPVNVQPEKLSYLLISWMLTAALSNFFLKCPDIKIFSALWTIFSVITTLHYNMRATIDYVQTNECSHIHL